MMIIKHFVFIVVIFILLGCCHVSGNIDKIRDLTVDFYPCDSLGIAKYEFAVNEPVYVKCVLTNQSASNIKYTTMYDPDYFFRIEYYENNDSMLYTTSSGYCPEEMWKEYFLLAGAKKIGIEKYERDHEPLKSGRYWIELQLKVDFDAEYQYIYSNRRKIIYIKEINNEKKY